MIWSTPYEMCLKNPPSELFLGSQRFLGLLRQQIDSQTSSVIGLLGLPGSGKSALLRHLHWELDEKQTSDSQERTAPPKKFVLYVQFGELAVTQRHPFLFLYERFQEKANSEQAPWANRPPREDDQSVAIRLLHDGVRKLGQSGNKVIFLFDDFHLAFAALKEHQTMQLQYWKTQTVMVVGTPVELSRVNKPARGSTFAQISYLSMPRLSDEEADAALAKALVAFRESDEFGKLDEFRELRESLKFEWFRKAENFNTEEDRKFLVQHAGGHVSLLLRGAHIAWQLRQTLELKPDESLVGTKDFGHRWKGKMQEVYSDIFERFWWALDEHERWALVQRAQGVLPSVLDAWACASLVTRGLLDEITYEIFSKLFVEYLLRMHADYQPPKANFTVASAHLDPQAVGVDLPRLVGMEAELYHYLKTRQRACTYRELVREIWQKDLSESPKEEEEEYRSRLATTVSKLRSTIKDAGYQIENVRDYGYRLKLRASSDQQMEEAGPV